MPLKIGPVKSASAQAGARRLMPTKLGSKELAELIAPEVKARATFSAHVESARVLDAIRKGVEDVLNLTKRNGMTMRGDELMMQIQRIANDEGIETGPEGTIQDVKAIPRLRLIVQMNEDMAVGYARHRDAQEQLGGEFPAWEFTRVRSSEVPRQDWPDRWEEAARDVNFEGVATDGRMIALKNSPIWARLSVFGTPWEPFDWGSGMGTLDVDRDTALESGALKDEDQELKPAPDRFNANLRAGIGAMDKRIAERLESSLGDNAAIVDDSLVWGD